MIVKAINLFVIDLSIDLCKKYWISKKSRVQQYRNQQYISPISNNFRNQIKNKGAKKNDSNNFRFQSNHFKPELNSKKSRDAGSSINFDNCYSTSK